MTHTHQSDGNKEPTAFLSGQCRPSLAICVLLRVLFYVQKRLQLHSENRKLPYDTYYFYWLVSLAEQLTVYMRNNVEQVCKTFVFKFKSMSHQCVWESSWSIARNWHNKWWRVKLALANRRGFCHLHLIIAALETVRLGTVTNGTKGSFCNSAASYSNRKLFTIHSLSFRQATKSE